MGGSAGCTYSQAAQQALRASRPATPQPRRKSPVGSISINPSCRPDVASSNESKLDAVLEQLSKQGEQLSSLAARVERSERRRTGRGDGRAMEDAASDDASISSQDYSSSHSDGSSQGSGDEPTGVLNGYAQVQSHNSHWGAATIRASANAEPRRYSLHGNEVFDGLKQGRRGGGGTLGFAMRWNEPIALFSEAGLELFRATLVDTSEIAERLGGHDGHELRSCVERLAAAFNTLEATSELQNTFRTLVAERAKVQAPGSSKQDKAQQEWVERQIDDVDIAQPDAAARVRKLQAEFQHEAHRADLKRSAASGGAASGGGYGGRSDDRDRDRDRGRDRFEDFSSSRRSKSAKRRERRSRQEGTRDSGGGGRDRGRRERGSSREGSGRREQRDGDSHSERRTGTAHSSTRGGSTGSHTQRASEPRRAGGGASGGDSRDQQRDSARGGSRGTSRDDGRSGRGAAHRTGQHRTATRRRSGSSSSGSSGSD